MLVNEKLQGVETTADMQDYMEEIHSLGAYKNLTLDEQSVWLQSLQKKFLYMLSKGELPPVEMSVLYKMFDHHSFEKNMEIQDYKGHFLGAFEETNSDSLDAYVMSALIMVCDFLNADFEIGLQEWLQRTLISNQRIVPNSYAWAYYFQLMLEVAQVPLEIVINAIRPLLIWERYSQLSLLSRRSIFIWIVTRFWNIKSYEVSKIWLLLYPDLKALSDRLLEENLLNEQMSLHFCTYHLYGNIIHTQEEWKKFSLDFDKPQGEAFEKYAKQSGFLQSKKEVSKGRKKIVLVKDRIVDNSVFKVENSLIRSLMQDEKFVDEYDFSVLSMSYVDKSFDDEKCIKVFQSLAVEVLSPGKELIDSMGLYYNHLQKAHVIRDYIIAQDTDIMICDASCFDISNFLFSTRTAPKQIFWSHGNFAYDVEGIDKRISHFSLESEFEFSGFSLNKNIEEYTPKVKADEINNIREKFPKESFIFGTIGRLIKIDDDEYLQAVAAIMRKNPKTIYLACGSGNEKTIRNKVDELGIGDRFYFEGHIDPHIYAYVIDLWLEPFALASGESLNEYMYKQRPYIRLWENLSEEMKNSKAYLQYSKYIWPSFKDEYIAFTNKLIEDKKLLEDVTNWHYNMLMNIPRDNSKFMNILDV